MAISQLKKPQSRIHLNSNKSSPTAEKNDKNHYSSEDIRLQLHLGSTIDSMSSTTAPLASVGHRCHHPRTQNHDAIHPRFPET